MTSFRDLVADGIALADDLTKDLQVSVTHKAWIGQTRDGTPSYTTYTRQAIVTKKQTLVRAEGRQVLAQHSLFFMEVLADTTPTAPYTRANPIDPQDVFVLPDGTTGTVIPVDGFYDPTTGRSYYQQVYLA